MEPIEEILNFCNTAIFFDFNNMGIEREFNQIRKLIINRFHESIPISRIIVTLSIIDKIILKIINDEIDDIREIISDIHDLRENILYMLSFERTVKDETEDN